MKLRCFLPPKGGLSHRFLTSFLHLHCAGLVLFPGATMRTFVPEKCSPTSVWPLLQPHPVHSHSVFSLRVLGWLHSSPVISVWDTHISPDLLGFYNSLSVHLTAHLSNLYFVSFSTGMLLQTLSQTSESQNKQHLPLSHVPEACHLIVEDTRSIKHALPFINLCWLLTEPQNHRIAEFGRYLWRSSTPIPLPRALACINEIPSQVSSPSHQEGKPEARA